MRYIIDAWKKKVEQFEFFISFPHQITMKEKRPLSRSRTVRSPQINIVRPFFSEIHHDKQSRFMISPFSLRPLFLRRNNENVRGKSSTTESPRLGKIDPSRVRSHNQSTTRGKSSLGKAPTFPTWCTVIASYMMKYIASVQCFPMAPLFEKRMYTSVVIGLIYAHPFRVCPPYFFVIS